MIIFGGIIFIAYTNRYDILLRCYEDYKPHMVNLTEQEKLEDFQYYYDTMLASFPMLEEYKEAYGYDFEARKEYYEQLVRETESDYEFFCVMSAIVNELPSFHTDLVFPRFDQYKSLGCYNEILALCNTTVYPASKGLGLFVGRRI